MDENGYLSNLKKESNGNAMTLYQQLFRMSVTELLVYLRKCGLRVPSDTEVKGYILKQCNAELKTKINNLQEFADDKLVG